MAILTVLDFFDAGKSFYVCDLCTKYQKDLSFMLLQYFDMIASVTLSACSKCPKLGPFTEIIILNSTLPFENSLLFICAFMKRDDGFSDYLNRHSLNSFAVNN